MVHDLDSIISAAENDSPAKPISIANEKLQSPILPPLNEACQLLSKLQQEKNPDIQIGLPKKYTEDFKMRQILQDKRPDYFTDVQAAWDEAQEKGQNWDKRQEKHDKYHEISRKTFNSIPTQTMAIAMPVVPAFKTRKAPKDAISRYAVDCFVVPTETNDVTVNDSTEYLLRVRRCGGTASQDKLMQSCNVSNEFRTFVSGTEGFQTFLTDIAKIIITNKNLRRDEPELTNN